MGTGGEAIALSPIGPGSALAKLRTKRALTVGVSAAAFFFSLQSSAFAAEPVGGAASSGVEEIIFTAQKREERLQANASYQQARTFGADFIVDF